VEEIEGSVGFHHLLPGVRVLEARDCAHRWVVYHETYDFCLITRQPRELVSWKYNHRLYTVSDDHVIMAMQPGELHANVKRTLPGDFIVVQVAPDLMQEVARGLGWRHAELNIKHPHPASTDPALIRALRRFRNDLCNSTFEGATGRCSCLKAPDVHAENLVALVEAFICGCAEHAFAKGRPSRAPSIVSRTLEYLTSHYQEPYCMNALARVVGCDSNPYYMLRCFKSELGISPSEFQRRILVSRTCEALTAFPDKPLEVIAREVGWRGRIEDARRENTVIKHFGRTLGTTPDRFRMALRTSGASTWRRRAGLSIERALSNRAGG